MLIASVLIALVLLLILFAVLQSLFALALTVLVALAAGLVAEGIAGNRRGNPLVSIVIGFAGAVVGTVIAELLNLPRFFSIGGLPVIWTVIGAIIVALIWGAVMPARTA